MMVERTLVKAFDNEIKRILISNIISEILVLLTLFEKLYSWVGNQLTID